MKETIIIIIAVLIGLTISWNLLAYRDIELLESKAPEYIGEMDMVIVNYDGYQGSITHGGFVWYKARDKNGYLYEFNIGEWRGELMLYNMTCLNAVQND